MARKKIYSGKTVLDVVVHGIRRRVTGLKAAIPAYAFGYRVGNARFAGWLAFLAEKLKEKEAELKTADAETRWKIVKNTVASAAEEWRKLPEGKKMEYIKRAQDDLKMFIEAIKSTIGVEKELEKLMEEAEKVVEEVAEVVA